MDTATKEKVISTLREYAENRWFSGEKAVKDLEKEQDEYLEENWSVEMSKGEQNDKESELFAVIEAYKADRASLFQSYARKYHAIHDLIKKIG